jgi:putative hydrolase of the HAD superfamily
MSLLFIFDMDDVLYSYNWRVRMEGMTAMTGFELDELRRRWWHDEGEWAAEAGEYESADAYLAAFESAMGMAIDEDEWVRVRGSAMTVRPDSLAAVRRASELGEVTLLTNNGPLAHKHLAALAPELVELFGDHLFTSSHYGARKPDPRVFERVLAVYGVAAEDAFFVDDMRMNVEGARSVGITAHLFSSPAELLAAIEAFAASRGVV